MINQMIGVVVVMFILSFLWSFYLERKQNHKMYESILFSLMFGFISVAASAMILVIGMIIKANL